MRVISYYGLPSGDVYSTHLAEIKAAGFNVVVLCVPEHYAADHLPAVRDLIAATKRTGLECWADPWRVGGVFDGEAPFEPGQDPDAMVCWWIDQVGSAPEESRPDAIFFDNPWPSDVHSIAAWAARAKGYGISSQICLSADRHRDDLLRDDLGRHGEVARLAVVDGCWADAYALCPDQLKNPLDLVGAWAGRMASIAAATGKPCGVFTQGFGLDPGHEDLPVRAAEVARSRGIDHLGFWWLGWADDDVGGIRYGRGPMERFSEWLKAQG